MKKIYLFVVLIACTTFVFAQSKTGVSSNYVMSSQKINVHQSETKTVGDTLMHFDGSSFFVNPVDEPAFNFLNEDIDGLPSTNPGWTAYMGFYSLNPQDFLHNDVDSAFMIGATSWFTPPGQADDWFSFGPLTIPALTGAKIVYAVHWNPAWRDGYEILVSTTGMDNYTSFTDPAIYSLGDLNPNPNDAIDTLWSYRTINIPSSYNGIPVYISFHHNANDMDVLWIDEISVIEEQVLGLLDQNTVNANIFSNDKNVYVNLPKTENGIINIYDGIGQLVKSVSINNANTFINMNDVASGIYLVNVKIGDKVVTKKVSL